MSPWFICGVRCTVGYGSSKAGMVVDGSIAVREMSARKRHV